MKLVAYRVKQKITFSSNISNWPTGGFKQNHVLHTVAIWGGSGGTMMSKPPNLKVPIGTWNTR